jgi:hypothetical protein
LLSDVGGAADYKTHFPQFPNSRSSKIPGKRGVLPNNAHSGGSRRERQISQTLENPGKTAVRRVRKSRKVQYKPNRTPYRVTGPRLATAAGRTGGRPAREPDVMILIRLLAPPSFRRTLTG